MSKDNFSFIDEVFEQYQLGDATLKHQKAIEQAKQELQQGFKAAMLEGLPEKKMFRTVTWSDGIQSEEVVGHNDWSNHMGKGYNQAIEDVCQALETLVNSKEEHKPHKRNGEVV